MAVTTCSWMEAKHLDGTGAAQAMVLTTSVFCPAAYSFTLPTWHLQAFEVVLTAIGNVTKIKHQF